MATTEPPAPDLALLAEVIRDVGRRARLSADDALDFAQTVHLRLIETGYAPLRRFEGRCAFRTYLVVVVRRMLLDWQRATRGKWRHSAPARRAGRLAMALERLIHRDGFTVDEATAVLQGAPGAPPPETLRRLAGGLPVRLRRRPVPEHCIDEIAAATDPLEDAHREEQSRRARHALARAFRHLSRQDRLLLALRYGRQHTMPAISRLLEAEPKRLYRRCDRVLRQLRRSLEANGVHSASGL